MSSDLSVDRRSSVAEFELIVQGRSHDVAQVAPDFLILAEATPLPAGPATLLIRLDGEELRREIELPDGADGDGTRVVILRG